MRRMKIAVIYRMPLHAADQPVPPPIGFTPYLLHQLAITRQNHVRSADITNIPMRRGSMYLCAILD